MPRTERVNLLVENFYQDFMSGMSRCEIEERYGVSKGYSLKLLPEIANKNGVDVEFFYQMAHGPHIRTDKTGRIIPQRRYSKEELEDLFKEAETLLNATENCLKKDLENRATLLKEWDKEFKEEKNA